MKYMKKHSLVQVEPANGLPKLDHCFAHPSLPLTCQMHHQQYLGIPTDHPALVATVRLPKPRSPSPEARTYNLSLLKRSQSRDGTKRLLLNYYHSISPDISRRLQWISRQIDTFEEPFGDELRLASAELAVRTLEDALVGIMDVVFEKRSPSCASYTQQPNLNSATEIVSSYQRLLRQQCAGNNVIISSDRGLAAEEECANIWEQIWNKEPNRIRECVAPPFDDSGAVHTADVDEVRSLISKYRSTKACGEDGIHVLVLKALLPGPFAHHLTTVYNLLLPMQVTPSHWNHAIVCMLPKDSTGLAAKCRPISLTPMLRRIFEKIIYPELKVSTIAQIHLAQSGFTQFESTLHPLQLTDQSHRGYRVLYDAMYAFDSPLLHILSDELLEIGIPRGLHRCIHYLFCTNLTSTIIANGVKSRHLSLSRHHLFPTTFQHLS